MRRAFPVASISTKLILSLTLGLARRTFLVSTVPSSAISSRSIVSY
jgi:hypothetical protein